MAALDPGFLDKDELKALIVQHGYEDPTKGWVYPFFGRAVSEQELEERLQFYNDVLNLPMNTADAEDVKLFLNIETLSRLMTMTETFQIDFAYDSGGEEVEVSKDAQCVYFLHDSIYSELEIMLVLAKDDLVRAKNHSYV